MAPRAIGALLALVAALLFLMSLAGAVAPKVVPAWWDGHPSVDGKMIERKDVHVGLLGAHGCNLGEQITCEDLPTTGKGSAIGLGEIAAIALASLLSLLLVLAAWTVGDRRKLVAKIVLGMTILAAAGGVVLFALGPDIKSPQTIDVPIGIGMMAFWAAIASATVAAMITVRLEREPLRLKQSAIALPPPAAAFDFEALLRDDQAGLRPLYDPDNAGVVPVPNAPALPTKLPTPVPISSLAAYVGMHRAESQISPPEQIPPPLGPNAPTLGSLPPPARPKTASKSPTLAHAVPPPPTTDNIAAPSVLPARDINLRLPTDDGLGLPTGKHDAAESPETSTAVEIDAEGKAKAKAAKAAAEAAAALDRTDQNPVVPSPAEGAPLEVTADHRIAPKPEHRAETVNHAAERPSKPAVRPSQVPISTAPASLPPPRETAQMSTGPTPACPQCEAPMAWVEEHLRFYCAQCRMYF